jgi:hypothetical protein
MAALENVDTGARRVLFTHHLVGRSRIAHLCLQDANVSAEHASLRWTGSGWELRDLDSRNGTFVDGRRLDSGERMRLARDAIIGFGAAGNRWRLVDDSPPTAMAICQDRPENAPLCAQGGFLAVPEPDHPEVVIYGNRAGEWVAEQGGAVTTVADGDRIEVAGQHYVLHLPAVLGATAGGDSALRLDALRLRFAVSSDEEYVELTAIGPDQTLDLGARAHHYLLLTLARTRLRDRAEGAPPGAEGWMYRDELTRMLGLDDKHLNITVYRIRQQLGAAGVVDAAGIVERRAPTHQLRLGARLIEIVTI